MLPLSIRENSSEKDHFWKSLEEVVKRVPSRDYLLVLMDANARIGMQGIGWTNRKVMGAYRRDELNDNGKRLLLHNRQQTRPPQHVPYQPTSAISYTFQSPNRGKARYRLDYTQQAYKRLVRSVTVPTVDTPGSGRVH